MSGTVGFGSQLSTYPKLLNLLWVTANCNTYCQTLVFGLGLGVDFNFAWDNTDNNDKNNSHLNFVKGTVLGDKEQGVRIRDKG